MILTLSKLYSVLEEKDIRDICILILLVTIIALVEVAGVASIMPFIALVSNPELVESNLYLQFYYNYFSFQSTNNFIFCVGIFIVIILLLSSFLKILAMWFLNHFAMMKEYTIGKNMLERYLKSDYLFFTTRHSGKLGKILLSDISLIINQVLLPFLNTIAQLITVFFLFLLLIYIDPTVTMITFFIFGSFFYFIFTKTSHFLRDIGSENFIHNEHRFKLISEIFSGIKQIKIEGLEKWYLDIFKYPATKYAKTQVYAATIKNSPKHILEGFVFSAVIILILFLIANGKNLVEILPKLTLFVFCGYKFLPALQQTFSFLAGLKYSKHVVDRIYSDYINIKNLNSLKEKKVARNFVFEFKSIEIMNISFSYKNNSKHVFEGLSLVIPANKIIGIVGKSGSGKTTLVDLIIGLIKPDKGTIVFKDNTNKKYNPQFLKKFIGYVAQNTYIIDGSIKDNIAFGVPKDQVDLSRIIDSAKKAEIYDFIVNELKDGFDTMLGEKGVRFSGGQIQRIGIARALYKNPSLLILDESTSALDIATEEALMKTIYSLERFLTILIISHKPSTVKGCDQVLLLKNGEIESFGNFSDLYIKKNGLYQYKKNKNVL